MVRPSVMFPWSRSLRRNRSTSGAIFLQDNKTTMKLTCREGELVQDIIRDACHSLDIPPMARVFFALCVREKGVPFQPLNPYSRLSRQDSKKQYQLRVFVNVENSHFLVPVGGAAHDYYYKQLRNDFIDDLLQPRATINSAVWMAAIDMAREAKLRNKKYEDLQGEMQKFMPEFLLKRYKKDEKIGPKLKETFDRFHELSNVDSSHYVNKFLEVYEKDKMCGRHIFPLKQSGLSIRAAPAHLIIISHSDGIYKTTVGDPDDKKEPICSIADIATLRADFSLAQLTISWSQNSIDSDSTLYFVEQKHLVAFSVIVQAYWRLKVDGSQIILSGDLAPPDECVKIGKSDRISLCHGPISQTSVEQVLSKFDNKEGHFLVRESRSIDDAYTLSVCHNNKVMHYRIVRHKDGTYSFKDPDRTERDSTLEQSTQPYEYEKFPTLHDLIKSYHQKADGLPTILKLNIAPNVAGKIPLLSLKSQPGSVTPSGSESRPQSSSSEDHSYVPTVTPTSSTPQTPSESHPPPQLLTVESPPPAYPEEPTNEYILGLYRQGVPFIRYKDLNIVGKLGQGHFSKVFRAQMKDRNGEERTVAVKIPEVDFDNSSNAEAAKKDLTKEMLTMHSFNHHNIVTLVSVSETPHYLDYIGLLPVMIMEFVPGGSLRGYLDKKRANITADLMSRSKTIFVDIGQQIAEGMKYLEERKVVHRDLAARNVLMVDEAHVKISDFGLSRIKKEDKEYYRTNADQASGLPIFWYSPECLLSLKFTTQGDIWSYGTTLWEIFTFGDNPSSHLHPVVAMAKGQNPYKVLADVYRQGKRLPRGNCNASIMKIINSCWSYDPLTRPSFDHLANELRELLQNLQHQGRETAPKQLQQDNGYVPMERTMPQTAAANGAATFPHNGAAVISPVAS